MLIASLWNTENKNLSSNDDNPKLVSGTNPYFIWQLSLSICFSSKYCSVIIPAQ